MINDLPHLKYVAEGSAHAYIHFFRGAGIVHPRVAFKHTARAHAKRLKAYPVSKLKVYNLSWWFAKSNGHICHKCTLRRNVGRSVGRLGVGRSVCWKCQRFDEILLSLLLLFSTTIIIHTLTRHISLVAFASCQFYFHRSSALLTASSARAHTTRSHFQLTN